MLSAPITTKAATAGLFELARRAPFNIAPERAESLASEIFGSGKWSIAASETEANFYAVAEDNAIYLSYAGLASLWCLAFTAFHLMDIASRRQRMQYPEHQANIDIGDHFTAMRLGEYVAYARSLFHTNASWPSNLVTPKVDALLDSEDGRINNLFFGALSWVMLHEIGHVHHRDEKLIPVGQRIRQEYRADGFATKWILDCAGQGLRREFRVLMISVALTWLFMNEAELGRGSTHPPAILRFRETIQHFKTGQRSVGLENAAYLLKAVLDPLTPPPVQQTPEDSFEWICARIEQIFPA